VGNESIEEIDVFTQKAQMRSKRGTSLYKDVHTQNARTSRKRGEESIDIERQDSNTTYNISDARNDSGTHSG
jgi:hypothetical protein